MSQKVTFTVINLRMFQSNNIEASLTNPGLVGLLQVDAIASRFLLEVWCSPIAFELIVQSLYFNSV